jgi:glycosyltransferase involved in cell wall biosynthesis
MQHDLIMATPDTNPTRSAPVPARAQRGRVVSGAVEVVIPVYNEERVLAENVRALHRHLKQEFRFPFTITIADNASEDSTLERARGVDAELAEVQVLHLDRKGRGGALRAAWGASDADVLAYMDVDLSTDLSALRPLITPLLDGSADLAIGSRLAPGAEVTRSLGREFLSRAYNILLRTSLGLGVSDAQCGFKAIRREVVGPLLELVEDDSWFFDTELLYHARRSKLAIREVPVRWVEDVDSRVDIAATVREDLKGIRRLRAGSSPARAAASRPAVTPALVARPSRRSA